MIAMSEVEITTPVVSSASFTVDQKSLVDALTVVSCAIAKRSTLPVLQNVKFTAHRHTQHLMIEATNLETFAKLIVPASVETTGAFTVDYKELLAVIKPLKKAQLTFTLKASPLQEGSTFQIQRVCISGAGMTVLLPTIDAIEFPSEPSVNEKTRQPEQRIASVPVATFRQMINSVYPAAAEDYSRPVFCGIHFRLERDVFIAEAADAFRLHIMRERIPETGSWDRSLLLDALALRDVCKRLPKTGYVTLESHSSAFATLTCGLLTVHFRIIEATYPRVENVIPKPADLDCSLLVDVQPLKTALLTIAPIARDSSNIVRLKLNGSLTVQASRDGMENPMTIELDALTDGPASEAVFNYQYLLDVCNVAPDSLLHLTFAAKQQRLACHFTLDTIPGFEGMIMQMSTNK